MITKDELVTSQTSAKHRRHYKPSPVKEAQPSKTGSPTGGARPGSGRKPGTVQRRLIESAILDAKNSGLLPHEILLAVARGDPTIFGEVPSPLLRMDAAKAAAPYFAARLASMEVTGTMTHTTGFSVQQLQRLNEEFEALDVEPMASIEPLRQDELLVLPQPERYKMPVRLKNIHDDETNNDE